MAARGAVFIENWSSRVIILSFVIQINTKRHNYLLKGCQSVLAVSFSWWCSLKKVPPWLQQRSSSGHGAAGSESSPFLLLCPQPCVECGTSSKQLKMSFRHEQRLRLVEFHPQFGTCGNLGRGGWNGSMVVFPSNKLSLSLLTRKGRKKSLNECFTHENVGFITKSTNLVFRLLLLYSVMVLSKTQQSSQGLLLE